MIKKSFNILFAVIFTCISYSQDCVCDFNISKVFFNESIVGYSLSAFDPSTGQSDIYLFEYMISNNPDCYNDFANLPDLRLNFSLEIFSPSLGFNSLQQIVDGSFKLRDITGDIRFKNTDLNLSNLSLDNVGDFSIDYLEQHLTDSTAEEMLSYVVSSNKIPNGTYIFRFTLEPLDNSEINCSPSDSIHDEFVEQIEVYEPTYLELVSPGSNSYSNANNSPIFTTYPVFNWNADMCSGCDYGIRVCEYDPLTHSSLSEAINDVSSLPVNQSQEFYPISSSSGVFQYPSIGALELESGNFYVWQLQRSYQTTVGINEEYSDIYIFKINSFDSGSNLTNIQFLRDIIGDSVFDSWFGPGGELDGYELLNINLNDVDVQSSQLQSIMSDIEQGNIEITGVEIE